jgi:hypothetical protein
VRYRPVHSSVFLADRPESRETNGSTLTTRVEAASELELPTLEVFASNPRVADAEGERRRRFQPHSVPPSCPETFCTRIDGGAVWTKGFLALSPSGHYLSDSLRTRRLILKLGLPLEPDLTIGDLPPPASSEGTAVLLGTLQTRNYFHWLFESVARIGILALSDVADELAGARYITPELTPLQRDSLLRAGLRPEQLFAPTDPFVQFSRLYVPSRGLERIFQFSRAGVEFLRGLAPAHEPGRRLYLSRRNSRQRRVENEAEVIAMLSARGFEEVVAENLSFDQQVDLFSRASAIVAPHGAGLANIAFMPPGGTVLEIQPEGLDGTLIGAKGATRHSIDVDPGQLDELVGAIL